MSDSAEDWKEWKTESNEHQAKLQKDNTEICVLLCAEFGVKIKFIAAYHLRLAKGESTLDYFPRSGKATWLPIQKFFRIQHIDEFIQEHFNF